MASKLTLSVNSRVVEVAKSYAKSQNTSLSKLIENYLLSLTKNEDKKIRITPLVESLAGSASGSNEDFKKEYTRYLEEKYH